MANLFIAEIHGSISVSSLYSRFRIVEKVLTIDGQRDRLTNQSFSALDAAKKYIENYEEQLLQSKQQVTRG